MALSTISTNQRQYQITKERFLYGIKLQPAISMIFTLFKRSLILQREEKNIITEETIKDIIMNEYNVEKYIATKHDSLNKFNARWKDFRFCNDT